MAARVAVLSAVFVVAFGTAAFAGGTKGSPQPGLTRFDIGAAGGSTGSGTVLPDGDFVIATPSNSETTIAICVLHPGGTKCASIATLKAHPKDSFGPAQIFATGGSDVTVAVYDCCYIGLNGVEVFNSTNDGKSWSSLTEAGDYGADFTAGTYADGQIVVGADDNGAGTEVQAFSPHPTSVETKTAKISHTEVLSGMALSTYNDGVLVASDGGVDTHVWYAAKGSDFNSGKSYKLVDTIKGQAVLGMSGAALLTVINGDSLTSAANLQVFNGKSFSKQKRVPAPTNPDDGAYAIQDVGSTAHIFFLDRRLSYDIFSETTSNGGDSWSHLAGYSSAIQAGGLVPILGPSGAGLCYETDGKPLWVQPILNAQSVSISVGGSTLKGSGKPVLNGYTVTLEKSAAGGFWDTVKTTKESSSGKFSFSVSGDKGTYRAVVNGEAGYILYGYSNSVTIK
ncbi:MAG: hypothetical protein ACLPQS_03270 [Acidimicrobiales bacterium]